MPEQKLIRVYAVDRSTYDGFIGANDTLEKCLKEQKEDGFYVKQISAAADKYLFILFEKYSDNQNANSL